jgi:hypothetical protein
MTIGWLCTYHSVMAQYRGLVYVLKICKICPDCQKEATK